MCCCWELVHFFDSSLLLVLRLLCRPLFQLLPLGVPPCRTLTLHQWARVRVFVCQLCTAQQSFSAITHTFLDAPLSLPPRSPVCLLSPHPLCCTFGSLPHRWPSTQQGLPTASTHATPAHAAATATCPAGGFVCVGLCARAQLTWLLPQCCLCTLVHPFLLRPPPTCLLPHLCLVLLSAFFLCPACECHTGHAAPAAPHVPTEWATTDEHASTHVTATTNEHASTHVTAATNQHASTHVPAATNQHAYAHVTAEWTTSDQHASTHVTAEWATSDQHGYSAPDLHGDERCRCRATPPLPNTAAIRSSVCSSTAAQQLPAATTATAAATAAAAAAVSKPWRCTNAATNTAAAHAAPAILLPWARYRPAPTAAAAAAAAWADGAAWCARAAATARRDGSQRAAAAAAAAPPWC